MNHEAMDSETVAGLLSVGVRQLTNYSNLGLPFEKRGRERIYDWPKVLEWYVAFKSGGVPMDEPEDSSEADEPGPGRKENLTQANLRKTKAEADLKQLLLAQKRGQVVSVADAKAILDRLFGNLKSQLLGAAPLLNSKLEGEPDSVAREGVIRGFMEDICRELATGKIVRNAVAEAEVSEADEEEDEDSETIDSLSASADEVTDDELNDAILEWIAADAELQAIVRSAATFQGTLDELDVWLEGQAQRSTHGS